MEMRRGLLQTHGCSAIFPPVNSSAWCGANPHLPPPCVGLRHLLLLSASQSNRLGRSFLRLLAFAIPISYPRDNSVTLGVFLAGSATSGKTGRSVLWVGPTVWGYGPRLCLQEVRPREEGPGPQLGWPVLGSCGMSLQHLGSQCPLAACPCWNSWKG